MRFCSVFEEIGSPSEEPSFIKLNLVFLMGAFDIAFNLGGVIVDNIRGAVRNKKSWGLLNAIGFGKLFVFNGVELAIGNAFAVLQLGQVGEVNSISSVTFGASSFFASTAQWSPSASSGCWASS